MFREAVFDKLNCTVSPHLNLELGLGVRPEDEAGEYQIPNKAN